MYKVDFTPQAEDDLSRSDQTIAKRISNKIEWLCQNIGYINSEPLTGKFKGKFKLRVGDWRIIYSIEHSARIITIYAIEHRSRIYKT